jgi:hypothetical protein
MSCHFTIEAFMVLRKLLVSSVAVLICCACTTTITGTGGGQIVKGEAEGQSVDFFWTSSDDGNSGVMRAQVADENYEGRFFQITQQTRSELLLPLWGRWHRGWYDWPYWGGTMPNHATQFVTRYSGKVVATLESPNKNYMRCRFHLVEPVRGMLGGGEGECQLSGGRTVKANFLGQ